MKGGKGKRKGRVEMPSLPFPAEDSRICTSTTASCMAGPISRCHLLPTAARPAVTATRMLRW